MSMYFFFGNDFRFLIPFPNEHERILLQVLGRNTLKLLWVHVSHVDPVFDYN